MKISGVLGECELIEELEGSLSFLSVICVLFGEVEKGFFAS